MGLFGLCIGMTLACFHLLGMVFVFMILLYMFVRYVSALGPRCLRCCMFMLSGPVDLFVLESFIAVCVCCVVMFNSVVGKLCICRLMLRLFLCVVYFVGLVNCRVNEFAMSFLFIVILLLKSMAMLSGVCVFLLSSACIVFHSLWVFVLWSQSCSRCSFQMSVLCFCMLLSISLLRSVSLLSFGSFCLIVFLCVIMSRMCVGSSLCLFCIFPLGMCCLSACSMMLVIVLQSVCMLSVFGVFCMLFSMCSVNAGQFAFR